jgi:adenylate cyclase
LSFWESVRASDSPALIQGYLEKYPNGEFSALARVRVDELTPDRHTA